MILPTLGFGFYNRFVYSELCKAQTKIQTEESKMKKIIAAILAVCMMLTLFVGCGNQEQPN